MTSPDPTRPKMPPGFAGRIGYGFNVRTGMFPQNPVFAVSFNNGHSVPYGPPGNLQIYDIPDGFIFTPDSASYSSSDTVILQTVSDYNQYFSASIDIEYTGVSFSGSASSEYLFHGSLFQKTRYSYGLDFATQQVYTVRQTNAPQTPAFKAAIAALPTSFSDVNKQQFFDFFVTYGTHFMEFGRFGGVMTMQTGFEESLIRESSETEVKAAITSGYKGVVRSGKMSAEAAYSTSTYLEEHRSETAIEIFTNGGTQNDNITDYFTSVYDTPTLLLGIRHFQSTLNALSHFAHGASRKAAIKNAIEAYSEVTEESGSLFGSAIARTVNQEYQSSIDSLAVVTIGGNTNGPRGELVGTDDPSSGHLTIGASQQRNNATQVPYGSLTMPVPRNEKFLVKYEPGIGRPPVNYYSVPFINGDMPLLKPWQTVQTDLPIQAGTDGLVICSLIKQQNGDRGKIEAQQGDGPEALQTYTGCSIHYYTESDVYVPRSSLCMPVAFHQYFKTKFTCTSGSCKATTYFIPLEQSVQLDREFQNSPIHIRHTAATDGFLVAWMRTVEDGDRGWMRVTCGRQNVTTREARTSVHYYTGGDIQVPCNSVMMPVSEGEQYTIHTENTFGSPITTAYWLSVKPRG